MKSIFLFVAAMLILGGCASTKTLEPNLSTESYKTDKQPYVVAIDGSKLANLSVTARPGAVELTVVYGDALLESVKHKIKSSYKNVYIFRSQKELKEYDYLASISNSIVSTCGATNCGLVSKTLLDIQHSNMSIVLHDKEFNDKFEWREPGDAVALGALTGLTLFLTSPVTIPAAVDIENEELKNQVSDSNDRVSSKIADAIIDTTLKGATTSQSKDQATIRLEKLKELHNSGLITNENFEEKQKEILNDL